MKKKYLVNYEVDTYNANEQILTRKANSIILVNNGLRSMAYVNEMPVLPGQTIPLMNDYNEEINTNFALRFQDLGAGVTRSLTVIRVYKHEQKN